MAPHSTSNSNSNSSISSIQKRRQLHRRQQSLEVPILATPLPASQRRNQQAHQAHRRGLSLDQSLSALNSPTGFRPLLPQDHNQLTGSPTVRIQLDTTNTGQPDHQHHFVQATQQQSLAQPGYQAQDFHSHLHQQLNGLPNQPPLDLKPVTAAPQPTQPLQQTALQELQQHMEWYRSTFGSSPNPNMPTTPFFDVNQPVGNEMPGAPTPMLMMQQMSSMPQIPQMPHTPVSQGHSRTVPNTPQSYAQGWPSPPPTNAKHARSQSFQLDVAPMTDEMVNGLAGIPFGQPNNSFAPDTASFVSDHGYASSAYSSSAVDPMSPCPRQNPGHLPTLFEEPTPPFINEPAHGGFNESSVLLQATSGAQDFNDPDFDFGAPVAMSPRQQLINNLGPEIPASIVDTGIPAYEVQQYMGELSETDNKYPCLYEGCSRRFGRKENVRAHIQTHLGDRQFKCNLCDKTFVRQHDLKRHIAIHSDDRPFICPCGTGFARHDALTRHRQRGMCDGALPGFEKTEEEKPKRGRPKKERPDLETRTEKSTKQRKKNKDKSAGEAQEQYVVYASSSSGASERSFPVTPPSDAFDADAFLNMANGDVQFDSITNSWRDTPPTSPVSASPTKTVDTFDPTNQNFDFDAPLDQGHGISPSILSNHSSPAANAGWGVSPAASNSNDATSFHGGSSPAEVDFFDDFEHTVAAQPDIGFDAFSPPGESNSSSSTYNYSDHDVDIFEKDNAGWGAMSGNTNFNDLLGAPKYSDAERSLEGMLDEWIANH